VTPQQAATNANAAAWLAEILEGWRIDQPADRAAWVVAELLKLGIRPLTSPPPMRGPGADPDHRAACKADIDAALAEARDRARRDGAR
jgi:hypothetical protein